MAIGWALVSLGSHAETFFAPAIAEAEGAQLVAVYSREHARAEAFAATHGAHAAYTSLETLLADARVDVVWLASPNFLHAPYTIQGPNLAKGDFLAKSVRSGAQSSGESAVMLAGTRYPAFRAARKCAQTAYCEVLPALEAQTHVAQFIGLCSGVKTCYRRRISLVVSAPMSRPLEVFLNADPLACPPAVQCRNLPSVYPYAAVERSSAPMSPMPEPGRRSLGDVPLPTWV
jgi:Oxidoreductase family, NAD-binding Rossmann fold